jgi:hypothetical protein
MLFIDWLILLKFLSQSYNIEKATHIKIIASSITNFAMQKKSHKKPNFSLSQGKIDRK